MADIMIDDSARLTRVTEPFVHFVGDGVIDVGDLAHLRQEAPPEDLFAQVSKTGPAERREYRFSVLSLVEDSRPCLDDSRLSSPWRRLLGDLRSASFHGWLHRETGVDVSGCAQWIGLFMHADGDFQGVSTGKLGKALGVSIYINNADVWPSDGGGAFELRAGGGERVVGEVLPQAGRCLAFWPTTASWHATQPVRPHRGLRRLFLTMQYFAPVPGP